jgi:3-dehydroquinate synthase
MKKDGLTTIDQRFDVSFNYPVHFTRGLFEGNNPLLDDFFGGWGSEERPVRVLTLIDSGIAEHWPGIESAIARAAEAQKCWTLAAPPEVLAGGEQAKNDATLLSRLYLRIQEFAIDRHCCIMVLGGGALIDAVGYAAATAHRGIRLLRLPTTVLSQNDAGVGVKNSINALGAKNFLGTFAPPAGVINDLNFLRTLRERDRRAGMAESVKVALIKDGNFFTWLVENASDLAEGDEAALEHLIVETARLHLNHIAQGGDPFESGSARPLDYGHWAAHKLEAITQHRLSHGEAVAIGIALDTRYAVQIGLLNEGLASQVISLLKRLGLPLYDVGLEQVDEVGQPRFLLGLEEFRQHLGGELCVTLLRDIGDGVQVNQMALHHVIAARDWLKEARIQC